MATGTNVWLTLAFFFILATFLVGGEQCPQQTPEVSASTNEKARNLAGSGTFRVYDKDRKYYYKVKLCYAQDNDLAVEQHETKKPNITYIAGGFHIEGGGNFPAPRVFGGSDWLMIHYFGDKYNARHCGGVERQSIIYIECDRSADTHDERMPKMIEEYRLDTKSQEDKQECYYLFEMKHDGVCPPEKVKLSPGSVFIIIVVIIGVLYLVLGLLYQRFIVGAKGMEQLPNYLMWREFGTLQADGCNYVCRGKGRKEPTRYKPLDDAIGDDEDVHNDDNDDAMLPM